MVLVITQSGSKKIGSTTYSLKCEISLFPGPAVWSRNGTPMSTCFSTGCLTTSFPPYSFRHDAGAIYVDFATLGAEENGTFWTCEHIGDSTVQFIVEVDDAEEEAAELSTGAKVGIVVGGAIATATATAVALGIGFGFFLKHMAHRDDEKVCYVDEGQAISLPLPNMMPRSLEKDGTPYTSYDSLLNNLEFEKVTVDDEGLYTCTYGTNKNVLKYRLVVVETEKKIETHVGESVILGKHIADGDAKADAVWTKNGERVQLNLMDPTKVKIDNISEKDEGKYVCTFGPSKMKMTYNLVIIDCLASLKLHK